MVMQVVLPSQSVAITKQSNSRTLCDVYAKKQLTQLYLPKEPFFMKIHSGFTHSSNSSQFGFLKQGLVSIKIEFQSQRGLV